MDRTIGASAVVPVACPSTAIIVPTQANVDPTPIPVAVQLQTKFWTSCTKCGIALEYLMKYRDHLLRCPYCCGTFEATEKSLASIIGRIDSSVLQAPNNNDDVAAEGIEAQLAQSSSVPKNFQHKSGHGVSMRSALHVNENGSIMQPRHSKSQRQNLSEAFGGEYKIKARNNMEQIIGATSATVASASPHDNMHVTVAYYPVVDADDAALVAIPIQIPDPFWTSCDKCGFQFEYEFEYRDLLVKCPHCSNPFLAKEIAMNYKGSRTVEIVSPAHDKKNRCVVPSEEVAAKQLEVLQPIGGNIAFMKSGEKRKK